MTGTKHEFTTYDTRLDGPNKDREIAKGDWRDPDVILTLERFGTVEVDGQIQLQHDDGRHYDLQDLLRRAHNEGRRLEGVIIARDFQRHGS